MRRFIPAVLALMALSACDNETGPSRRLPGTARVVNGATNEAPALPLVAQANRVAAAGTPIEHFTISPDKVKATLIGISFEPRDQHPAVADSGESVFENCEVTYDRAQPSLSTRLECPFEVIEGTYSSMRLRFSSTFKVLVDDAVNSLYTDPSAPLGFSSTRPAGGAQFIDYVVVCGAAACNSEGNVSVSFTEPLVVDANPIQLTIVMHGLHTVTMERVSGVFQESRPRNLVPLFLVPSVTGVASVDFYSSYGTGRTFNSTAGPTAAPLIDFFVFKDVQGPTLLGFMNRISAPGSALESCSKAGNGQFTRSYVQNTSPNAAPPGGEPSSRPGGYLGRDAAGVMSWAMTTEGYGISHYSLWRMPEVTTIGGSTTLSCLVTANPPAPTSGNTYSSGAPPMTAPTATITMRLVTR